MLISTKSKPTPLGFGQFFLLGKAGWRRFLYRPSMFALMAPPYSRERNGDGVHVRNVSGTARIRVVLMIVRSKHGVDVLDGERIQNKRNSAPVWLHHTATAHIGHGEYRNPIS